MGDSKIDTIYWLMKHNINRQLEKNRFSDLATALIDDRIWSENFRMNIWSRCRCMNENVWKNNFEILNTTSEWVMPHWTFYFVIKIVQRPSFWKLDTNKSTKWFCQVVGGHSTIQVHIFLVTQWVEVVSEGTFWSQFFSEKFIFVFHVKKIKILDFAWKCKN